MGVACVEPAVISAVDLDQNAIQHVQRHGTNESKSCAACIPLTLSF